MSPFKSDAQRKYLHAKEPEIAARWDREAKGKKKAKKKKRPYPKPPRSGGN